MYTKHLVGGVDIRDFNQAVWTNTINGTSTVQVWSTPTDIHGVQGRLDMQRIVLPKAFATQRLIEIQLIDYGNTNVQRTIIDGVTLGAVR